MASGVGESTSWGTAGRAAVAFSGEMMEGTTQAVASGVQWWCVILCKAVEGTAVR